MQAVLFAAAIAPSLPDGIGHFRRADAPMAVMVKWGGIDGVFAVVAMSEGERTGRLVGIKQCILPAEGIRISHLQHAARAEQGQSML